MRIFFLFLFFYSYAAYSQNEYEHWVVDSYEINFCDSVSLDPNDSSINDNQGFATICDKNTGQILFFTDAQHVFNSNFQIMPNGNGLNGGTESCQMCLIVPQPGSTTIFYVFTTDRGDINGLNYSIVDMSKDGGLGDVTVKNVFLDSSSERLNAVYNSSNNSFWIIADNPVNSTFTAFSLNTDGINTTPVLSPTHVTDILYQNNGYLKSSPDGNYVAVTYETPAIAGLYSFDKNSGILNLLAFLPLGDNDGEVVGASFSPDNSKVYIIPSGNIAPPFNAEIYQYDITSSDTNTIKASRITIDSIRATHRFADMQMGPDGKIYVGREEFDSLSVISEPNLSGTACDFIFDEPVTPVQNYTDGFDNNIDGLYYFATLPNITLSGSAACNKTESFTINTKKTYNYFNIYFGDGTSVNLDGTQYNFSHQYDSAGTYTVKLYTAIGCVYDSATTTVTVDTAKCPVPTPLIIPNLIYGRGSQTQWSIINLPTNTSATIYDELGRVLYKTSNYLNNYDMRNLPPAMYFYRLTLENGQEYSGKIVLVK